MNQLLVQIGPQRIAAFFLVLARVSPLFAIAPLFSSKLVPMRVLRHAIEIRHQSFLDPAFVALLRRHRVALVFADSVSWPYAEDLTADFVYLRLHGSEELYASGYDDNALDRWAARIRTWSAGTQPNDAQLIDPDTRPRRQPRDVPRDVYVYFDNDAKVHAPFDAQSLRRKLAAL